MIYLDIQFGKVFTRQSRILKKIGRKNFLGSGRILQENRRKFNPVFELCLTVIRFDVLIILWNYP
jgi:hypothetical protein